jgi:hypothetical protein
MPGQQLANQAVGAGYESFAETVLGRIAAMVPVPREQDFGVDFYALPRVPLSVTSEKAIELCAVQVKPANDSSITYGGVDKNGSWRGHEIEWLKTLNVPLYIATADSSFSTLSLYSTGPALGVYWRAGTPCEIICQFSPPSIDADHTFETPTAQPHPKGVGFGDAQRWTVNLGPPFLHLQLRDLVDKPQREVARDILLSWVRTDRASLSYLHMGVPRQQLVLGYRTNLLPQVIQHWMFWNPSPGASTAGIERAVGPIATVLVQWLLGRSDTEGLKAWLPALEWLAARGSLDDFGTGAIREAKKATA